MRSLQKCKCAPAAVIACIGLLLAAGMLGGPAVGSLLRSTTAWFRESSVLGVAIFDLMFTVLTVR